LLLAVPGVVPSMAVAAEQVDTLQAQTAWQSLELLTQLL
jgi:hypothetical protein